LLSEGFLEELDFLGGEAWHYYLLRASQ
jgi:hypothetical protein